MSEEPHFDLDEANALLPRMAFLMERIHVSLARLDAVAATVGEHARDGDVSRLVAARPEAQRWIDDIEEATRAIVATGAHLKDVRLGLVDFPTRVGGEVVYLCWQYGESQIGFWHRITDGFAGRKSLPGTSGARSLQ